jgi:hypothetical protein
MEGCINASVDHLFWPTLRESLGRTWPCTVWLVAWDFIRICCVDITPPLLFCYPIYFFAHLQLFSFTVLQHTRSWPVFCHYICHLALACIYLDFGLSLRCDGLSLLGWQLVFTPTILGCYMWPHRATLPV